MSERDISQPLGPRFFYGSRNEVLFELIVDQRSSIGPRLATEADKTNYDATWRAFRSTAGRPRKVLDESAIPYPSRL